MKHKNPAFPAQPFGLLLVEGGDERPVCERVAGSAIWARLCSWSFDGRNNLLNVAKLARRDAGYPLAQSVGIVMDNEEDPAGTLELASSALQLFDASARAAHRQISTGSPRVGAFLMPDGVSHGSVETLCRSAASQPTLAACVDQLVACAGNPHPLKAQADKAWTTAYVAMVDPHARFYQSLDAAKGFDPAHAAFQPLRDFLTKLAR